MLFSVCCVLSVLCVLCGGPLCVPLFTSDLRSVACACPCFRMRAGVSACGGVRGVQRVKCALRAFIVGCVFRV